MREFEEGKPYIEGKKLWPEGVEYGFTKAGHELRMFFNNLSKEEIQGVRKGEVKFALAVEADIILLLYNIKGAFQWSDCPYSIHMVPDDYRQTPDVIVGKERMFLQIFLIEAATGILKAMRFITFSHDFTVKLHEAINQQLTKPPITRETYKQQVNRIQTQIPTQVLLSRAVARCVGGS